MSSSSDDTDIPLGTVTFTGWKAVAVIVLILGFLGYRIMSFGKEVNDKALYKSLETQIACDYLPGDAAALKKAVESGDKAAISKIAKSVSSTKAKIESVNVSYPVLSGSSNNDVIVKVVYSLVDSSGTRDTRTKYYKYSHSSLLKHWSYQYETTKLSYYMNFM